MNGDNTHLGLKDWVAPIVAGVLIVVLIIFYVFLYLNLNAATEAWSRLTYMSGGMEAIAFVAAGYLFGKEVNRQQAQDATADKKQAQAAAKTATDNGNKLKTLILTKLEVHKATQSGLKSLGAPPISQDTETDLQDLANLANTLFP
jgi:hypothetical protein